MEDERVLVKCIAPLRKSRQTHDAKTAARTGRKSSLNRLVATLGDIFASQEDEDKIQAVQAGDTRVTWSEDGSDKLLKALAELEDERAKTREMQHQLDLAMDMNTELKVSAGLLAEEAAEDERRRLNHVKSKLYLEVKRRELAEAELDASRAEVAGLKAALEAGSAEKQLLESELLEAAYDVLQKQKLETALQGAMRAGEEVQRLADERMAECLSFRVKLRTSEDTRMKLEREMTHLRAESAKFEEVLDILQEQVDAALLQRSERECKAPDIAEVYFEPCSEDLSEAASESSDGAPMPVADDEAAGLQHGIAEWCDRTTDGIAERATCSSCSLPAGDAPAPSLVTV